MNTLAITNCIDRVVLHFKEPNIIPGNGRYCTCRSFREAVGLAHHYIVNEGFGPLVELKDWRNAGWKGLADLGDSSGVVATILKHSP
jgi:hypothetical protein